MSGPFWLYINPEALDAPGTSAALAAAAQNTGPVYVLLDGRSVRTELVAMALKSDRQAQKTAAFMVEDNIAAPIDSVHAATGALAANARAVAVIDRTRLEAVTDKLKGAGISPRAVIAEYAVYPKGLWQAEGRIIYSDGSGLGFSIDEQDKDLLPELTGGADDIAPESRAEKSTDGTHMINLLQGDFAPSVKFGALAKPYKRAAFLLAGVFVVWSLGGIADIWRKSEQIENLHQATQTLLADNTIGITSETALRDRIQALHGRTENAFLQLAAHTLRALEGHPDITLAQLRYDGDDRQLVLSLRIPDYNRVAAFKAELARQNLWAQEGSSQQTDDGILAEITVGDRS